MDRDMWAVDFVVALVCTVCAAVSGPTLPFCPLSKKQIISLTPIACFG